MGLPFGGIALTQLLIDSAFVHFFIDSINRPVHWNFTIILYVTWHIYLSNRRPYTKKTHGGAWIYIYICIYIEVYRSEPLASGTLSLADDPRNSHPFE